MAYRLKEQTITVRLPEPYQEVEVVGLRSVRWSVLSEIASLAEKSEQEKATGYLPRIEGWLRDWLRGWNIEEENGQPFPIDRMRELPANLVIAMFNAMSTALAGGTQLPPEPAPPSTPT